ncbi:hypothetical protein H5410_005439 [Solanum commersonii]|uniref:Uncharacterized protein n=1 Tax=Solanum commersonii TaxID=4109 RepID=A0A9J6A6M2_SOLCO|nr:hypothetical protein H5410_005439 [Solanum commersonii]
MLRVILVLFEGFSGLYINWRKSHLYPITQVHNMEALNVVLGGEIGALPTSYLGMPLGAKSQSLWSEFKANTKIKVRNGEKTEFWKDVWHEAGRLEVLYPDIYSLVSHQQKTIVDHLTPQGWNFIFRKQLNDWEIQRVADFFNTIGQFNGLEGGQDILWWKGNRKGSFKVGCAYNWLNHTNQL